MGEARGEAGGGRSVFGPRILDGKRAITVPLSRHNAARFKSLTGENNIRRPPGLN